MYLWLGRVAMCVAIRVHIEHCVRTVERIARAFRIHLLFSSVHVQIRIGCVARKCRISAAPIKLIEFLFLFYSKITKNNKTDRCVYRRHIPTLHAVVRPNRRIVKVQRIRNKLKRQRKSFQDYFWEINRTAKIRRHCRSTTSNTYWM